MEQRHTPGPWKRCTFENQDGEPLYEFSHKDRYGGYIAHINTGHSSLSEDEHLANANLIAAAPDLLAACELALITCDKPYPAALEQLGAKLQSAIAKATGKGT